MTELITATATTAINNNIISLKDIETISAIEVNGDIITLIDADKKDIVTLLNEVSEKISDKEEAHKIAVDAICGTIFGDKWELNNYQSETFKKLLELKKQLQQKKEVSINTNGITATKHYNILCERVKNDRNGNPCYNITIFDKEAGCNVGWTLKNKVGYKLLKRDKFSIVGTYNIKEIIKDIITAIEI